MILEALYLTIICCYIIDMSGIVGQFKRLIHRLINGKIDYIPFSIKPFDCSLCMTFWVVLINNLIINDSDIIVSLLIAVVASYMSTFITDMMKLIYTLYNKLINKII